MLTPIDQYHANRDSIDKYIDFIEETYIHRHEKLQIIKEIARLEAYNENVRQLEKDQLFSPVELIDIEIESKLWVTHQK